MRRTAGIFLIVYAFVLFVAGTFSASSVSALESGLVATVYNNFGYNGAPPLPAISGRPEVGQMTVSRVEQNFDQSPPFNLYEDFIVRYEGFVTSPVSGTFNFMPTADDGTKLYIDDVLVQDDWVDKGGGGEVSSAITFEAGVSKKFEMWFYENGGGAWTTLFWNIDGGWEVVPDSAFTKQVVETTTTTIAPFLNAPQNLVVTSTNESKVYLSWDAPDSSNADVERYAIFWSCDNWESGFAIASTTNYAVVEGLESDKSCEFKIRADNDSIPVYSGWSNTVTGLTVATTTTTTTTTATTTTTIPEETTTTTTEAPMQETTPVETSPSKSNTKSDEPVASVPQYASEQTTTTTTKKLEVTTTTTISQEILSPEVSNLVNSSETLSKEEIKSAVENIIKDGINGKEAESLATDKNVIASVTAEQATEIFSQLSVSDLSDEQAEEVIAAVQGASEEVRDAFQEEIDIFGTGKFETYVPIGSTVSVADRRSIIAAATGAVLALPTAAGGATGSGGPSGGGSGGPSGGGSGGSGSSDRRRFSSGKL